MSGLLEQPWILVLFVGSSIVGIGIMIWALLEIRRILTEAQRTLTSVQGRVVLLLQEMHGVTEQADGLVRDVREAFQSTLTLWYALGEVGQAVERARSFVSEKTVWIARLLNWGTRGAGATTHGNGFNRQSELVKRRSVDD